MRFVVLNSRGCAGTPVTSPYLYSAAETSDVASVALLLSHMYPQSPVLGIGFSLGGAIISKYLAECGKNTPLIGAISVCAPFEFNRTADLLDSTLITSTISGIMGASVCRLAARHADTLALDHTLHAPIESITGRPIKPGNTIDKPEGRRKTLRYADEIITRHVGGRRSPYGKFPFPSSSAYYDQASPLQYLPNLQRPLVVLASHDDPIIPGSVIDSVRQTATTCPHIILAETSCGGHLGYFQGVPPRRWCSIPIAEIARALQDAFASAQKSRPRNGIGSGGPQASIWKTGLVDARTVQVEVLPESALRSIYPDVAREKSRGTHHAWLRTRVLPHAPLVHPQDSPAGYDESTPSRTLSLKLYNDALRPEVGFIELPADIDVGNNGYVLQGAAPDAPVQRYKSSDP